MRQTFTLIRKFGVPLLGIYFGILLFSSICCHDIQRIHGHLFVPDENASFLANINQVQIELELIVESMLQNNTSLSYTHANKADSLSAKLNTQIADNSQRLAHDLTKNVNELKNLSSFSASKIQLQNANQLVAEINETLDKAKILMISEEQPDSHFTDNVMKFLESIFTWSNDEPNDNQIKNPSTNGLVLAELIDSVLLSYGTAYGVNFDMTNMSNMPLTVSNDDGSSIVTNNSGDGNNLRSEIRSTNSSSNKMTKHSDDMNNNYSLVSFADYQTAQALVRKSIQIFNTDLKPHIANNYSDEFVTNLDEGLIHLSNLIASKASPLDIMMIVHSEIHPNLLGAFNLELELVE
jgi:hypothetical protein